MCLDATCKQSRNLELESRNHIFLREHLKIGQIWLEHKRNVNAAFVVLVMLCKLLTLRPRLSPESLKTNGTPQRRDFRCRSVPYCA